MLWNRSLVMRDLETGSLWSHILGECMAGKFQGRTLDVLPGVMTTWKDWLARHPDTTVLDMDRTAESYRRTIYRAPEDYVYGIKIHGTAKAYPFTFLLNHPVTHDRVAGVPLVVFFDPTGARSTVYSRVIDGDTLAFERLDTGDIRDSNSGSIWDPWTGTAVSGPRTGDSLQARHGIVSFLDAWMVFHPETLIAGIDDDADPADPPDPAEAVK